MANLFRQLQELFPQAPLQVGTVTFVANGVCTLELPGGAIYQARGAAAVGDRVYFRDQVIEGAAPDLPLVVIEI